MMKRLTYFSAAILLLVSCNNGGDEWTLNGNVPEDVSSVMLELPSAVNGWYVADSVAVSNGKFTITRPRANSEMYRLNIGGRLIYVPADSTETLTLMMNPTGTYTLEGSDEAKLFTAVNEILNAPADSTTNRKLLLALQDNFGSTAAYYAYLRTQGNNKTLLRAVANAYSTQKPSDARTTLLLQKLKNATAPAKTGETMVIEAPEVGYFDIELMNRMGEMTSLSSIAETHALTLLAFVNTADETVAAANMGIGEAVTTYPQIGVYEVGFGENQHQWADATAELPWTNVFQSESASRTHLGQYALGNIPMFFLIKNDEIVERIEKPAEIKNAVGKHI